MNKYLPRLLFDEVIKWLKRREIIAIKGPRQSGKTTLLLMIQDYLIEKEKVNPKNVIFLTFEDREILEKFSKAPKDFVSSFIRGQKNERFYFLIDEFHYLEEGGQKLKLLYDIFPNVKFIITGSSSLEVAGKTAKFLVGRIFSFYLYQFSFEEFIKAKSDQLSYIYEERKNKVIDFILNGKDFKFTEDIFQEDFRKLFKEYAVYGGYPEVVKAEDVETKKIILKNIFETYITKDIIELLRINNLHKFRNLFTLLANQIGNLINYNSLSSDVQSYFREVKHFISVLEETFIIFLLRPYFSNKITELKKNPKVYFVDIGLRNYAINNFNELNLRGDIGQIVENICLFQLRVRYPDFPIKYWRTLSKAEVDFILELGNEIIPIEVKYSVEPKISRSLRNFISEYKPKKVLVITKGFSGEEKINSSLVKFIPAWYL
jgi:predicted AAA+ superfamily ATPase